MILYFPVSALVTLFGNILQNPLDARAKSDTKLMALVVSFLSMLGQEAEQGGVHRMLAICAEFERIAKLVIERAEKEQSSRRKRKTTESKPSSITPGSTAITTPRQSSASMTPGTGPGASHASHTKRESSQQLSPHNHGFGSDRAQSHSPMNTAINEPSPSMASVGWPQEFPVPQPGGDYDSFNGMDFTHTGLSGAPGAGGIPSAPFHPGNPLLPQDLFSLPMTLDWSWAEMSGGAYPTVENGNFDPNVHQTNM